MKVIMVSRTFPAYHPKAGSPTFFVEKILASLASDIPAWKMDDKFNDFNLDWNEYYLCEPKRHTIRAGCRWEAGDMASLRYWDGRPYHSKPVEFAQVEIKKVLPIRIHTDNAIEIQTDQRFWTSLSMEKFQAICRNDGLTESDFYGWFKMPVKETFTGQIICWSDKVNY